MDGSTSDYGFLYNFCQKLCFQKRQSECSKIADAMLLSDTFNGWSIWLLNGASWIKLVGFNYITIRYCLVVTLLLTM
jgi:hypothetical protein